MLVRVMLAAEAEKRPSARRVRNGFAAAIREIPAGKGEGGGVVLHCGIPEREVQGKRERERMRREERFVEGKRRGFVDGKVDEEVLSSSSVSEFDFGFVGGEDDDDDVSDANASVESHGEEGEESIIPEEEDLESILQVERVSPQLSLPDLDVNITGIEGLTFRG